VEKYCRAGQVTDDDMVHTHCMLDSEGCKHTLRIFNTYCCSTATVVTQTHLKYYIVHTLPVLLATDIRVQSFVCYWLGPIKLSHVTESPTCSLVFRRFYRSVFVWYCNRLLNLAPTMLLEQLCEEVMLKVAMFPPYPSLPCLSCAHTWGLGCPNLLADHWS